MTFFRALVMAFVTYSRIPMPRISWEEKSGKYQLCFFPAVGLVIGAGVLAVDFLCGILQFDGLLRGVLLTAVPLLLTGGIHLDGFLDTVDALSSFAPKEKKLEILKDSNAGAFAVIYGCMWFLTFTAALAELRAFFALLPLGFVLSRAFSALAVLLFRPARDEGMGAELKRKADSKTPFVTSIIWIAAAAGIMLLIQPVPGAAVLAVSVAEFFHYKRKAYREFGGFTGDLAGWFLCRCELGICLVLAVCERVMALWF